jgi:hypothetical protein
VQKPKFGRQGTRDGAHRSRVRITTLLTIYRNAFRKSALRLRQKFLGSSNACGHRPHRFRRALRRDPVARPSRPGDLGYCVELCNCSQDCPSGMTCEPHGLEPQWRAAGECVASSIAVRETDCSPMDAGLLCPAGAVRACRTNDCLGTAQCLDDGGYGPCQCLPSLDAADSATRDGTVGVGAPDAGRGVPEASTPPSGTKRIRSGSRRSRRSWDGARGAPHGSASLDVDLLSGRTDAQRRARSSRPNGLVENACDGTEGHEAPQLERQRPRCGAPLEGGQRPMVRIGHITFIDAQALRALG